MNTVKEIDRIVGNTLELTAEDLKAFFEDEEYDFSDLDKVKEDLSKLEQEYGFDVSRWNIKN